MVTSLIGGARASVKLAFVSSEICGHLSTVAPPEANFMAKAKQVGKPQSLHPFVLGSIFTISDPLIGIIDLLPA